MCSNVMMQRGRVEKASAEDFGAFYRREMRALLALAVTLTGSRETAAELAQEAMTRAFRNWDRVARLDSPWAWVRRVVINLSIDEHRRSGRERALVERLTTQPSHEASNEVESPFWREARSLPPRQRAVIALRYVGDLDINEIAQVLTTSTGTVKKLLFVARRTLSIRLIEEVSDANVG